MTAEPPRHNYTPKRPSSDVPGYDRSVTPAEPVPADLDALRATVDRLLSYQTARADKFTVLVAFDLLRGELEGARRALRACRSSAMDFAVGADQACLDVERIVNEALGETS